MNRQQFQAARRMARLVRRFESAMGDRIQRGVNSLARSVPIAAYVSASDQGDALAYRVRLPGCTRWIHGPRGVLPA